MRDTSGAALDRYHELLRAATPVERLKQAVKLTQAVRKLALAGIRQRHPNASAAEVRVRLAVRLYGREVATRVFGDVPPDAV